MQSKATTVDQYLAELDSERSKDIGQLLELVRKNIKPGFDETMRWGMISFEVPTAVSGKTYNNQPLSYVGIASQKHHISIYLMALYAQPSALAEFQKLWAKSGKKLDMGKGCVRFKTIKDADLEALTWAVSRFGVKGFLELVGRQRKN